MVPLLQVLCLASVSQLSQLEVPLEMPEVSVRCIQVVLEDPITQEEAATRVQNFQAVLSKLQTDSPQEPTARLAAQSPT